jgi:hypothetical protein
MSTYKIVRKYKDSHPDHNKVIARGLTLEEAQAHCNDLKTEEKGVWFDCYYEEGPRVQKSKYVMTVSSVCEMLSLTKGV